MSMKIGADAAGTLQKILDNTPYPSGARNVHEAQEIAIKKALTAVASSGRETIEKLQGLYAKHAALPVDSPARKAVEKEIATILKSAKK